MLCRADTIKDENNNYKYCYWCGEKLDGDICVNKHCKLFLQNVNKLIKNKAFYNKIKKRIYDW